MNSLFKNNEEEYFQSKYEKGNEFHERLEIKEKERKINYSNRETRQKCVNLKTNEWVNELKNKEIMNKWIHEEKQELRIIEWVTEIKVE